MQQVLIPDALLSAFGGESMGDSIGFRWLETAGVELRLNDRTFPVDPRFTRRPFRNAWFGRGRPDEALVAEKVRHFDPVLITHVRFDAPFPSHLAPAILEPFGV